MPVIEKHYGRHAGGQIHARQIASRGRDQHAPLICLHPAPSSGLYFTTVMPLLNAGRCVIAPDYPGYGGSDALTNAATIFDYAQAMLEFVDNLMLDGPIDIFGFHTGCLVGAEMTLLQPERVRRLLLCDVPCFDADQRPALRARLAQPMPLTESLDSIAAAWQFNVSQRIAHVGLQRAVELLAEHLRAGSNDYRAFAAAFSYDCETRLPAVSSKTKIIATQSGLLDATRAAAALMPAATLIEALDITTAVFESSAERIARYVIAALEDTHE